MKPLLSLLAFTLAAHAAPLALHPENPHYFLFRGKPALLITSAEHYGAVLNADFDYVRYLDTLAADGLKPHADFQRRVCGAAGRVCHRGEHARAEGGPLAE